jgi:hypothetical protein
LKQYEACSDYRFKGNLKELGAAPRAADRRVRARRQRNCL